MAWHCSHCGFLATEGANYCSKCGTLLARPTVDGPSTASYQITDGGLAVTSEPEPAIEHGVSLVIRLGGGREGESFAVDGNKMSIGRRPDSDVFLDDVTVSRNHAVMVSRADGWHIDDLGSLNGTYVNRKRIETALLADGDEVQIGKFRLSFLVN